MTKITVFGLDLTKTSFQIHCADEIGAPVLSKKRKRGQVAGFLSAREPCRVAMGACAGARHRARMFQPHSHGVRLIVPRLGVHPITVILDDFGG